MDFDGPLGIREWMAKIWSKVALAAIKVLIIIIKKAVGDWGSKRAV